MPRIDSFELSHLILRFEQEKDMKVMHCVQNLAALRDLVDLRIEYEGLRGVLRKEQVRVKELEQSNERLREIVGRFAPVLQWLENHPDGTIGKQLAQQLRPMFEEGKPAQALQSPTPQEKQ